MAWMDMHKQHKAFIHVLLPGCSREQQLELRVPRKLGERLLHDVLIQVSDDRAATYVHRRGFSDLSKHRGEVTGSIPDKHSNSWTNVSADVEIEKEMTFFFFFKRPFSAGICTCRSSKSKMITGTLNIKFPTFFFSSTNTIRQFDDSV